MNITIAERLRPFSLTPGVSRILPGSSLVVQVFPTRIILKDVYGNELDRLEVNVNGPVKDFTVQQDLEKGCVKVWGRAVNGYMRYFMAVSEGKVIVDVEKNPVDKLLQGNFSYFVEGRLPKTKIPIERLSLGNHKKQDWDIVMRRGDIIEILPAWFRLGSMACGAEGSGGALLDRCRDLISNKGKEELVDAFHNLFCACFDGILTPQYHDMKHQGLMSGDIENPSVLLSGGARIIKSMFIQQHDNELLMLPVLPSDLHCGRFIRVSCGKLGRVDFEWTKKLMRRMTFYSDYTGELRFSFQRSLKNYRFRQGKRCEPSVTCGETVNVEAGKVYYFDNFKK